MTPDIIKWGLFIGTLILVAIELGGIAASIRNIDRTLAVLMMHNMIPGIFDEVMKEVEGDKGNE